MNNSKKNGGVVLGGMPKLNLLPPSYFEKIKKSQTITLVFVWIIIAVLIAMAGIAWAWFQQNQKVEQLAQIQQETQTLQAERDNFPDVLEVRKKLSEIVTISEAMPSPFDYAAVLESIDVALPEDGVLRTATVNTATVEDSVQIAVVMTIEVPLFIDAADYIAALDSVEGFSRLEFSRAELRTEVYEDTLSAYFLGEPFLLEGAANE